MTTRTKATDTLRRVFRGGGWSGTDPSMFRSADRFRITPADRNFDLGFRCAQRGVRMTINDKDR